MDELAAIAARLTGAAERVSAALRSRAIDGLDDAGLRALLGDATEVTRAAGLVLAAASAVADRRSERERGADGFAQKNGHRSATSLVQSMTGLSRAETTRTLQAGHDLIGDPATVPADAAVLADAEASADADRPPAPEVPSVEVEWRARLRAALAEGRISTAQHHAIRAGLGEPPVARYPDLDPTFLSAAWARAVEILLDDAASLPVEELRHAARTARDRLDPLGVEERFARNWEARSFRRWVDEHGQHHARIAFDDEGAAWVDALLARAVRSPRSPRFVPDDDGADAAGRLTEAAGGAADSPDAAGRAEGTDAADAADAAGAAGTDATGAAAADAADAAGSERVVDDRSTPQRLYDHVMAVWRTGSKADPRQAFGDHQPGVRIVIESTAFALDDGELRVTGLGHVEDRGTALPGGVIEKYLCDAGAIPVIVDPHRRPLDLGREKRLFTGRQRTGILAREGGCIGHGCDAPASQTEIHHIDHWWEHAGKTDVDDGVPLCTPCHLNLHNTAARIRRTRDPVTGDDAYWLHPPPDPATGVVPDPIRLRSRSPLRFAAA